MKTAIDMTKKSLPELKALIENHERLGRTDSDRYRDAAAELAQRNSSDLDLGKTVAIIAEAARRGVFISYRDVGDGHRAAWNKVMLRMPNHLLDVSRHVHGRGLPMISAIVVNKQHVGDGRMEAKTLAGFCRCARSLGFVVDDEATFLESQQQAVFQAAKDGLLT